jgi:hypothetical protein
MMWGAKGEILAQGQIVRQPIGNRVDASHIEGFTDSQVWQDVRYSSCHPSLAAAGWTSHQHVVTKIPGAFISNYS